MSGSSSGSGPSCRLCRGRVYSSHPKVPDPTRPGRWVHSTCAELYDLGRLRHAAEMAEAFDGTMPTLTVSFGAFSVTVRADSPAGRAVAEATLAAMDTGDLR